MFRMPERACKLRGMAGAGCIKGGAQLNKEATNDTSATYIGDLSRGRTDGDGISTDVALALAARRRTRDGQHARPADLATLRDLPRRSQGQVIRNLIRALEHHAAISVRRAPAG